MARSILIAEPCDLLRIGLRTIFTGDSRISSIHEVTTYKGLEVQVLRHEVDLILANQTLISDIALLPAGKFVILAPTLNASMLKACYKHKGCGYLSVNASAELLRTLLDQNEDAFLIEPNLAPYVMDHFCGKTFSSFKEDLLTPREKEILALLHEGFDRTAIANTLCISKATLKTHIRNIASKRDE